MLEKFRRCSGLELNKSKTEAMWLGSWVERKDKPFGFRWPEVSAYALGIHFTNDSSTSDKLNFEKKLEDLQRILNSWKRRKLTLLGKINIVKVTVDLQGCLPKNHSYARRLCFNHRKVYIIVKLIKCKIRKNKHF